jgi:chaperonin cofactor prefoldin
MNSDALPTPDPNNSPLNDSTERPLINLGGEVTARSSGSAEVMDLEQRVADLRQQEQSLRREIESLQASYTAMLKKQIAEAQVAIAQFSQESLSELEQRKQTLQIAVEQLERRQERIRNEMRTTFAGTSQDLAIRVQGFKDYLVGSLQDLVTAAEQLQLAPPPPPAPVRESQRSELQRRESPRRSADRSESGGPPPSPQFAESGFQEQTKQIRRLLDQYRMMPDYYGPPWQLRRTFEPVHADRVSDWFFNQGGRGAIKSMGSRLQNILIAAASISVLRQLYGDRLKILVLGDSPERLGEWRRGLQDCLGISRGDFGADQGIVLFEDPEPLVQRADRLLRQKQLPFILIDESEGMVSLALLRFPLWLAFASDQMNPVVY